MASPKVNGSRNSLRILTDLLRSDPPPKELEITILPLNSEDDPTCFMKEGVHLGIHAPKVGKIAKEFRSEYYSCRRKKPQDGYGADSGAVVSTNVNALAMPKTEAEEATLMDCTSCLLLLCPDHATAWSDRRRLLLQKFRLIPENQPDTLLSRFQFWKFEIGYLNMLYTQHSKAPNAWAHRRWICRQCLEILIDALREDDTKGLNTAAGKLSKSEPFLELDNLVDWAKREIALCTVIAEKYPKNYYAWTHRIFITRSLVNLIQKDNDNDPPHIFMGSRDEGVKVGVKILLKTEVECVEPWLRKHVSDHSAAHYGGEALLLYLSIGGNHEWKTRIIQNMLTACEGLIEKFPSHEVMWIWKRILSRVMLEHVESGQFILSFLQKEISTHSYVFENEFEASDASDPLNAIVDEETRLRQHHSFTYVLWILKFSLSCLATLSHVELNILRKDLSLLKRQIVIYQSSKDNLSIQHIWQKIVGVED